MAYGDFKDLTRRTASDKILCDKAFNIAKNTRYDGYQHALASMVYKCFDKKTSGSSIKNKNISDKDLAEELNKPIIRKFKKRKVHSTFIDNIWGANIADMQLIRKPNKMRVDKSSEFYNRSVKSWLEKILYTCIQHIMKNCFC